MHDLIDDLLPDSRFLRVETEPERLDLGTVVADVVAGLHAQGRTPAGPWRSTRCTPFTATRQR